MTGALQLPAAWLERLHARASQPPRRPRIPLRWGGITIGLVQQMSTLILPTQLQNTAIFVIFLLIIFLRPQGFFGRVSERT